jgi:AbrB family looped-hinge helix DNA binding protein
MSATAKIQHKGQVTIPTRVREQAGLSKGDLVEFTFQRGKIVITPKVITDRSGLPNADDEYTPEQRRRIDRGIAQSEKDYKQGRSFGPFETHDAFIASLHKEATKLRGKKNKRAGK